MATDAAAPDRAKRSGETDPSSHIRRVLVCVGAGGVDTPVLQVAAGLAMGLRATLAGMYVEDEQLLRVAALPFTREFGLFSASPRDFSIADLKRSQRAQAEQLRRMLAALAEPLSLMWTLDVIQGELRAASFAQASETDLMVMGRPQLLPAPGAAPAGTRQLHPAALGRHPVAILHDGSAAGLRALQAALALVRVTGCDLVVLIAAADSDEFRQRQHEALDKLGAVRARLHRVPPGNWPAAVQAAIVLGATALFRPRSDGYETAASGGVVPPALAGALVLIP